MFYAVDPYIDVIRKRPEKKYCEIMKRFDAEYFETEEAARKFMLDRAEDRIERAANILANAKERLRRLRKKFAARTLATTE